MSQIETKLPVGLKCCDFCSLRRVDEGKLSGGLMIRRVARGKEKEQETSAEHEQERGNKGEKNKSIT